MSVTKFEQITSNIASLNDEFYVLSGIYNLHIISLKSLFINAALDTYRDKLSEDYNTVSILDNHQLYFYNTFEKTHKTVNISFANYKKIWTLFIKYVEKSSLENLSKEIYNTFINNEFIKLKVTRTSKKYLYFKHHSNSNFMYEKLIFKYAPKTMEERKFLLNNENVWIHTKTSLAAKIKKLKEEITNAKTPVEITFNPFEKNFVKKLLEDFAEKVRLKTKNKIDITIVNINEKNRVIVIRSSMFLPKDFILYIQEYIYSNSLYNMAIAKKRDIQ